MVKFFSSNISINAFKRLIRDDDDDDSKKDRKNSSRLLNVYLRIHATITLQFAVWLREIPRSVTDVALFKEFLNFYFFKKKVCLTWNFLTHHREVKIHNSQILGFIAFIVLSSFGIYDPCYAFICSFLSLPSVL